MEHFLQSYEWEEFQKSVGREVFRIGDYLVIKLFLVSGKSYFYIAGVSNFQFSNNFQTFSKQHNAVFLKIEPMTIDRGLVQKLQSIGFRKSKKEIQPQRTIILDITKSEDQILAEMHQKTRYNIRVGEKKELRIRNYESGMGEKLTEEFWRLLQKTANKDRFHSHSKQYYKKLLELPITQLFVAEHRGRIIAADIILLYEETAYYLHGASDYDYRNLMAPYLLHWETIKHAKEHGFKEYDFWGIDEKKWPGVTRFKKGFGGREAGYIGSYDYVYQPVWYRLYRLRQTLFKK